jgi:hypothetical protein
MAPVPNLWGYIWTMSHALEREVTGGGGLPWGPLWLTPNHTRQTHILQSSLNTWLGVSGIHVSARGEAWRKWVHSFFMLHYFAITWYKQLSPWSLCVCANSSEDFYFCRQNIYHNLALKYLCVYYWSSWHRPRQVGICRKTKNTVHGNSTVVIGQSIIDHDKTAVTIQPWQGSQKWTVTER